MAWSEETVEKVWQKALADPYNDSSKFRKDMCGAWIARDQQGNRNSPYGWEIDHFNPVGTDNIDNLQPLQWENNVDKSDGKLKCSVTANGTSNKKNT